MQLIFELWVVFFNIFKNKCFLEQTKNRFLKQHNWNNFENTITYDFFYFKSKVKKNIEIKNYPTAYIDLSKL